MNAQCAFVCHIVNAVLLWTVCYRSGAWNCTPHPGGDQRLGEAGGRSALFPGCWPWRASTQTLPRAAQELQGPPCCSPAQWEPRLPGVSSFCIVKFAWVWRRIRSYGYQHVTKSEPCYNPINFPKHFSCYYLFCVSLKHGLLVYGRNIYWKYLEMK